MPTGRAVDHDGPVVVLTLGHLRLSQAVRFLRTSRPAERTAIEHEGFVWGSAKHSHAITEQDRKDFHRQSAFIRFAPLRLSGSLEDPNPVDTSTIDL